jgi:hypothetical protein
MDPKTMQRIELFTQNAQAIRKEFIWQGALLKRLAALLYTAQNEQINPAAIRECYTLIKKSTGVFSSFRGNSAMTLATLLSLRDDPPTLLNSTLEVYTAMKEVRFWVSDYLVISAYQIAANAPRERYAETIDRARAFYDGMKQDHRFLTGQDDYIFSAMLGLSDIEVEVGVARMERLFQSLRPAFYSGRGVQALTQVLVLGSNEDGVDRVLALRDALRAEGLKLDKEYTLSSLGVLALLPQSTDAIVRQLADTAGLLRSKKGFGVWSIAKQELLLLSAGLVAFDSLDKIKLGVLETTLSTSVINIIIAQQTALIAAASASAAASSASN